MEIFKEKIVWVITATLKDYDEEGEPLNWTNSQVEFYTETCEQALQIKEKLLAGQDEFYGDLIEDAWISDEPETRTFFI